MVPHANHDRGVVVDVPRLFVYGFGLLAIMASSLGCEDSKSNLSRARQANSSPEAEFDWAMERLQRAVGMYRSSPRLGLRVTRNISFQLNPPDASQPNYTAQVTIQSKTYYKPERRDLGQEEEDSKSESDATNFLEEAFAEDAQGETISLEDVKKMQSRKLKVVEAQVSPPSVEERKVYEMAYLDGRWQLQTKIESEHEQLWFDYALQQ